MRLSCSQTILVWIFFWSLIWPAFADQTMITHPMTKVSTMSINSARAIFSMRVNQWPDGSSITVFVLPDRTDSHRAFAKNTLSIIPHQLRRSWDRYTYSGTGIAPIEVKDEQEMLNKIISTPGSIGYLNARHINEMVRSIGIE